MLFLAGIFLCSFAMAQKDTTKKQTIDIVSAYKPVLRNAVKITFSASQLLVDTSKIKVKYEVPAQNLFYTYQPVALRPLAIYPNDTLELGDRNYLKLGIGNYTTPYIGAGLSFGDGKTSLLNLYGDYIASKGKIKYQDYSKLNAFVTGSTFSETNEIYFKGGLSIQDNYLYGYDHDVYSYTKKDLRQQFQNLHLKIGARNINAATEESLLKYDPNLQVNVFVAKNKLSENTIALEVPVEMPVGDMFIAKITAKADITSYKSKDLLPDNVKIKNNVFQIAPEVVYTAETYTLHGGFTPTIDNGKFIFLPNIYGEAKLADKSFLVQAGFVGKITKNTYQYLSSINPYLNTISSQKNTKELELYGGIKGTVGKHFNYSAKVGLVNFDNYPFLLNDTLNDQKSFVLSNESKLSALRIHADMSYINQDKFTFTGGVTFNGYTDAQDHTSAFGTIPVEINAAMRWRAFNKVLLKTDLYVFGGGPYILPGNITKNLKGAADISIGAEFAINKRFSAFVDINNMLNNKYQRWHNYEVYGINALGGVIMKF
ncbi:hypothetical protein ACQ33O_12095 [Ferruginibacter sp. SUN002]|uniref:hypothetical protein n=1 Tax=Ferruginibacter sp. SUN002 TaxID=2937789 RepID=UPI003D367B7E